MKYSRYGKCSKFLTPVTMYLLKNLEKQCRPQSDSFFPVCYSDKYFVNSSPDNKHFTLQKKEKSVQNLRPFTIVSVVELYVVTNSEDRFSHDKTRTR